MAGEQLGGAGGLGGQQEAALRQPQIPEALEGAGEALWGFGVMAVGQEGMGVRGH